MEILKKDKTNKKREDASVKTICPIIYIMLNVNKKLILKLNKLYYKRLQFMRKVMLNYSGMLYDIASSINSVDRSYNNYLIRCTF
nr:MAG TPA: hypothetical protein [Microviridae sp.]